MSSHSYIEKEDLGLSVLGVTQYTYTVGGVHRQDYDAAVMRASLNRADALEAVTQAYSRDIEVRTKKIDELGQALASIAYTMAQKTILEKDADDPLDFDSNAASILRKYGFDASSRMSYAELDSLQEDVKYALDTEDNELQQDMTSIESYVSKRDDAYSTVKSYQDKIAGTRSQGIRYIGK